MASELIRVYAETKKRLESAKLIPDESMPSVVKRIVNVFFDESESRVNKSTQLLIEKRIKDLHAGNVMSTRQLKKKLFKKG